MRGKFATYSQDTSLQLTNVIGHYDSECLLNAQPNCVLKYRAAQLSLLHSIMLATLPAVRWHRTKAEIVHLPHNRCSKTIPGYQCTPRIYQQNAHL